MHPACCDSPTDLRSTNKTDEVFKGVMKLILKRIEELVFQTKFKATEQKQNSTTAAQNH